MKTCKMGYRCSRWLWICLLGLMTGIPSQAQVTVDVKIDSLELMVGEQTCITLDVSMDARSELEMPLLKSGDLLTPGVEVVDVAPADTQQLNEGARCLVSRRYTVTSFDSALYYLPPFVVKVDGKEYKIQLKENSYTFTMDIDGETFDGVFCIGKQGEKDVMTLSAVSDKNRTLWAVEAL